MAQLVVSQAVAQLEVDSEAQLEVDSVDQVDLDQLEDLPIWEAQLEVEIWEAQESVETLHSTHNHHTDHQENKPVLPKFVSSLLIFYTVLNILKRSRTSAFSSKLDVFMYAATAETKCVKSMNDDTIEIKIRNFTLQNFFSIPFIQKNNQLSTTINDHNHLMIFCKY